MRALLGQGGRAAGVAEAFEVAGELVLGFCVDHFSVGRGLNEVKLKMREIWRARFLPHLVPMTGLVCLLYL